MQEYLEHIPHWLQTIALFSLSLFKSYTGATLSVIFGYSYIEMILINLSAAFFSIFITYRFQHQILNLFKKKNKSSNGYSKKLKKMLIMWNKYGFIGAAIVSPLLISIPIGVILSSHFKTSKTKIFSYIAFSAFVWMNIFYFITKYSLKAI